MKKLLPIFILILSVSFFAQNECPKVKNNPKGIAKVSNLNSDLAKDFTCRKVSYTGTISGLSFDSDESAEVSGITIQLSNGTRQIVWIADTDLLDCFSEADKGNWRSQIKKGAKIKVAAWVCGAGGKSDLSLEEIEFLPVAQRKKQ